MANKKLSELTTKTSIGSSDLFPIADAATGQLYKKSVADLAVAIGGGVSSVNTLTGVVVLNADNISEAASPTNKYFTDVRARAALSAGTGISYNSSTGVITNTNTSAVWGAITGTLSSQTDLQTALNAKQATIALTTTGSNGSATFASNTLNIPSYTLDGLGGQPLAGNLTALAGLSYSSLGFIKMTGVGTLALDTNTYLTTGSAASTYLPLTGGTLSNDLTISSTNPKLYLTDSDNNPDYYISNNNGVFTIYDVTNSLDRFTIGLTGNANFRNAITGGGSITGESIYSNGIVSVGTSLSVGTTITAGGSVTATRLTLNNSGTSARIQVNGVNSEAIGYFYNNSGTAGSVPGVAIEAGTNSSDYALSVASSLGTSRFYVRGDGNVGIGTISPNLVSGNRTTVDINGTTESLLVFSNGGAFKGYIFNNGLDMDYTSVNSASFGAGSTIKLNTNGSERMRITSGGNVLIGTTTDVGYKLDVTGTLRATSSITASSYFESSDKNIKTLIKDNYQTKGIESVVAKLYTKNGKEELGYYAQDLELILPSSVIKGSDGLLSLSYREVHTAKIARLEKELEALKAKLK